MRRTHGIARPLRFAPAARALGLVLGAALVAAPPLASAATPSNDLRVAISVPSVLTSNGRQVWLANTGTGSVLELSAISGKELLEVKGSKYRFDNSDAITQLGANVWVANEASDTVTEFDGTTGALKHVLRGPTFHFAVPVALAAADRHVFVLALAGDKVTMINARTGRLVRYLQGPRYHFAHALALARAGSNVWVLSENGTLTELDAATGGVLRVATAATTRLNRPVAIADNGAQLVVVNSRGRSVSVLSAATGKPITRLTTSAVDLDRATSIAATDGTVWIASTARPAYLVGLHEQHSALVHVFRRRFGFPTVFADSRHVWVVDRLESRVTELAPASGRVLRTVVN